MSSATEWRKRAADLRQMAHFATDAERQRKLKDLADRWEEIADDLETGIAKARK